MSKIMRAVGLMSGTSLDGIDVAALSTDGEGVVERMGARTFAYPEAFRLRLKGAIRDAAGILERHQRPGSTAEVERELTLRHAEALGAFLAAEGIPAGSIDVVGFHGQTVLHRPRERSMLMAGADEGAVCHVEAVPVRSVLTVQLGDGALLASQTGIDVVFDLRANDCAHGGEGAPLVPVYHRALAIGLRTLPLAFVNVGGVANITWVGGDGRLVAFDTGPGNALIDDLLHERTGKACDTDGALAAEGRVHEDYVAEYLRHPYFAAPPPKSLDRHSFARELVGELSTADAAATLTAFTAASIAKAREHLPEEPQLWIVAGGGRRNRTLMSRLAGHVENAVVPAEGVHLDGDSLEAEAWAYLAVRSLKGLPISFPGTTGVDRPMTGGRLAKVR